MVQLKDHENIDELPVHICSVQGLYILVRSQRYAVSLQSKSAQSLIEDRYEPQCGEWWGVY
jgi:hypothetical protein